MSGTILFLRVWSMIKSYVHLALWLVTHPNAHVMTPRYDVTDVTYDVIVATVRDFLEFWAKNVPDRGLKDTSSEAELHGKDVGESFMSLRLTVFEISACKVEKSADFAKIWHLTCHNQVKYWPRVKNLTTIVDYLLWRIRSCFQQSSTTFLFETAGGLPHPPSTGEVREIANTGEG